MTKKDAPSHLILVAARDFVDASKELENCIDEELAIEADICMNGDFVTIDLGE